MTAAPHALVIVNPASSSGRTLGRWPAIEQRLRGAFSSIEVARTEAPGHATLLAREGLERGDALVISVGGDGTNNEVLCGFVDPAGRNRFPDAALGLVSSGTGADFHRHLGRPTIEQQVDGLVRGAQRSVDYGIARFVDHEGHERVRPFLNIVSVGLSGLVAHEIAHSNRLLGATGTYALGAVRGIMRYRAQPVRLTLDGDASELDLSVAVVANGQYFGGGMWIAPEARSDDGLLDLVHAGRMSRLRMLGLLARVFRGRHLGRPGVHTARVREARLEVTRSSQVVLIDLDGEQPGRLPLTVQVIPGGLKLRGV